jgi:hypothetical protein
MVHSLLAFQNYRFPISLSPKLNLTLLFNFKHFLYFMYIYISVFLYTLYILRASHIPRTLRTLRILHAHYMHCSYNLHILCTLYITICYVRMRIRLISNSFDYL